MKKVFISTILAIFLLTGSAFAQSDKWTKSMKQQFIRDCSKYAELMNRLVRQADELNEIYFSLYQPAAAWEIIQTVTEYSDSSYADETACTGAGGAWSNNECVFNISDQTTCEDAAAAGYAYTWSGSACQGMPDLNSTDLDGLVPQDVLDIVTSMSNLNTFWVTDGNKDRVFPFLK